MFKMSISGNVGADATLRTVKVNSEDRKVATFNVAAKPMGAGKDAKVTWVRCTAWGALAEVAEKYFKKGTNLVLEGTPGVSAYTNKNGEVVGQMELTVREFEFGQGSRRDDSVTASAPAAAPQYDAPVAATPVEEETGLPF